MARIWTDLLLMHGYLLRKDALDWRPDARPKPATTTPRAHPAPTARRDDRTTAASDDCTLPGCCGSGPAHA